jgi:diguanylate cyclase (GGDEF)-like protein/PAS domain S-box-containing protein
VLFSYIISNAICAAVMTTLWLQARRRSPEVGLWLADFIMQFIAVLLIALRGIASDFLSIVVADALIIAGTLLLYMGLERYVGKRSSQWHNYFLMVLFLLIQAYFTYIQPVLLARALNVSLALLVICSQCAWLMLRRVGVEMRPATRRVGIIFAGYSLVSVARVVVDLTIHPSNDLLKSGLYDTLLILTYQMLFIALTFALFLMVHDRIFAALANDIRDRKRAEEALRETKDYLDNLLDHTSSSIITWDTAFGITRFNHAFERLTGYTAGEVVGRELQILFPEDSRNESLTKIMQTAEGETWEAVEIPIRCKDGTSRIALWNSANVHAQDGVTLVATIAQGQDITVRKQMEAKLRQLSTHDPLTGLYNRGFFEEEMSRFERGRYFPLSIVMADLDGMKQTNDQEGHAAGDVLLKRAAQVLQAAFRTEDVIARIGGDEFAVLLPSTDIVGAEAGLQRLQDLLRAHNAERSWKPLRLSVGACTAVNSAPLSDVLKAADENMYREKRAHFSAIEKHTPPGA